MPLSLPANGPTLAIRRDAFESAGLSRATIDRVLNLTDEEFRVEGALIAIGPLPDPDDVPNLIDLFEEAGLVYFDDFMEIPGGFPGLARTVRQASLMPPRTRAASDNSEQTQRNDTATRNSALWRRRRVGGGVGRR